MMIRGPGRPVRYKKADGSIVASVTTICSRFKESGGLIQWAYSKGLEGKPLREEVEEAGDIGRQIHEWIEKDISGGGIAILVPQPTDDSRLISGIQAWMKWRDRWIQEFTHTEFPLVSEEYSFGGTPDAMGIESQTGKVVLLDWKSAGGVYAENLVQLAAYKILIKECLQIDVHGFHLVRFSKEHADLEHRHYDDLSEAEEQFLLYRKAYEIDKQLRKRAR